MGYQSDANFVCLRSGEKHSPTGLHQWYSEARVFTGSFMRAHVRERVASEGLGLVGPDPERRELTK